jgi:UDP-N-acetylglucosamine acyltransferase
MQRIHPTAIIDPRAQLAPDVTIGAYAVLNGPVTIGAGTQIGAHCVLHAATEIGRNCKIGPAAYVGMDPQHLRFVADEANPSYLIIGDDVVIRESARLHRSAKPGRENATRIGDRCFIMGAAHVGHDCVLADDVILADAVLLGGHCQVGQKTFMGGGAKAHQFVRIGRLCIIAGNEGFNSDVPPFAALRYGRLKGYNAIGCRRAGMSRQALTAIRAVFHALRTHRVMSTALSAIRAEIPDLPEVREIVDFIAASRRGIVSSHHGLRQDSRSDRDEAESLEQGSVS